MDVTTLKEFRKAVYGSFERGGDALFNLSDALVSESQAKSLAELSLSAFFERKWASIYEALEDGRIKEERLRAILVERLLIELGAGKTVFVAVDASEIKRAEAETSEDRGYIKLSNLPLVKKALSVGWSYSNVVLLPASPSSWAPPLDTRRIPTAKTAVEVAIEQLRDLKPLLLDRQVVIIADRGYATGPFLQACHDLGYAVLVPIKSDRLLYRPGKRIHARGPVPKDGAVFQGKNKQTHGEPDAHVVTTDIKGRTVQVRQYRNLHVREHRDLSLNVIAVERASAKGTKRDPRLSWFVTVDDAVPLQEIPACYELRFCEEHNFRFLKQDLLWTAVHVRTPEQFERWSWLVAFVMAELYLARDLGQTMIRPWESKQRPVTPAQVRRVMPAILVLLGTPALPCRPRGVSPGRPPGFHPKPAPRFPVVRKHPKKVKKNGDTDKKDKKSTPLQQTAA